MKYILLFLVLFLVSCVTPGDIEKLGASISGSFGKLEEAQVAVLEGTKTTDDYFEEIKAQRQDFEETLESISEDIASRTDDWVAGIQGLTLPDIAFTLLGLGGLHAYRNNTRRREFVKAAGDES